MPPVSSGLLEDRLQGAREIEELRILVFATALRDGLSQECFGLQVTDTLDDRNLHMRVLTAQLSRAGQVA